MPVAAHSNTPRPRPPLVIAVALVALLISAPSFAVTTTWTGLGGDTSVNTPANWDTGVVPGSADTALFNGTSALDCDIDDTITFGQLTLATGYAGTVRILVGPVDVLGAMSVQSGTFDAGGQDLIVGGSLSVSGGQLRTSGSPLTVGGSLTATSPGVLNASTPGSAITLTGSLQASAASLLLPAVVPITFDASNTTQTVTALGGLVFNDIRMTGTNKVLSANGLVTGGALTVQGTGQALAGPWALTDLTVDPGSDLTFNFASSTALSGNMVVSGTSAWGASTTLTLNGTGPQAVDNTSGPFNALLIANTGGAAVTFPAPLTTNAALSISGGTVSLGAAQPLTVGTTMTVTGGQLDLAGAAFDVSGNLSVTGTGQVTTNGSPLSVGGALTTSAPGVLDASTTGSAITLTGSMSTSSTSLLLSPVDPITFDASNTTQTVTPGGIVFNDLRMTGTNKVLSANGLVTGGALTVLGAGQALAGPWALTDLTVDPGSDLTFNFASSTALSGNMVVSGTSAWGASTTLTLNGTGPQAVDNTSGPFNALLIANTGGAAVTFPAPLTTNAALSISGGTVSLGAAQPLTVGTTMTVTGGQLDLAGAAFDVSGNLSVTGTGQVTTNGSPLSVGGALTTSAPGVLDASTTGSAITLTGSMSTSSTSLLLSPVDPITFDASNTTQTVTPGGIVFNDLRMTGTNKVLSANGLVTGGALTVLGAGQALAGPWALTDVTVDPGSDLTFNFASSTALSGDLVVNGTTSWSASTTLTLNGTGPQAVDNTSGPFNALVIANTGGAAVTFPAPLTTNAALSISGGTVSLGAAQPLSVGTNMTVTGGQLDLAGAAFDVSGNLSVSGTGQVTTNGSPLTVGGALTTSAPGVLDTSAAGSAITLTGSMSTSSTSLLLSSLDPITFDASNTTQTVTPGGIVFNDLRMTGTNKVLSANGLVTGGALTVLGAGQALAGPWALTDVTVDPGSDLTFNFASSTALSGDLVVNGTTSWSASTTLTLNGTGPQAVDNTSGPFNALVIANTGGAAVTFPAPLTTNAALSISGGTVSLGPAQPLSVGTNMTVTGGQLDLAGAAFDVSGNLSVSGTGQVTTNGSPLTVGGALTTSAPGVLDTSAAGSAITLTGSLQTSSTSLLLSSLDPITFDASNTTQTVTPGGIVFNDLRMTGTNKVLSANGLVTGGALTVLGTGQALAGPWALTGLTVDPGSDLTFNFASSTALSGDLVVDGTTAWSASTTLTLNGTGPQAVDNTSGPFNALVIANTGGAAVTFPAPLTTNAALSISGGTVSLGPAQPLSVGTNMTVTGGQLDLAGAAFDVSGNLSVSGTGQVTTNGSPLSVGGALTTSASGVLDTSTPGSAITLTGSLQTSSTSLLLSPVDPITFDASNTTQTVTAGGIVFNDLRMTGTNKVLSANGLVTGGALTIQGTGQALAGPWALTDLTVDPGADLTFNFASSTALSGDLVVDGTTAWGASTTLTLNGTGPQAVDNTSGPFNALVISNTGGAAVTFAAPLATNAALTLNDGSVSLGAAQLLSVGTAMAVTGGQLTLAGATMDVGSNLTVNGGQVTTNGAFVRVGGTLSASGTGLLDLQTGGGSPLTVGANLSANPATLLLSPTDVVTFDSISNQTVTSGGLVFSDILLAGDSKTLSANGPLTATTLTAQGTSGLGLSGSYTLANLVVSPGVDLTLNVGAAVTANSAFLVGAGSSLFMSSSSLLDVPGSFTNLGLIDATVGVIRHPAESLDFTNAAGLPVSSLILGTDDVFAEVADGNLNLDGTQLETVDTVLLTSLPTGDSEDFPTIFVTLLETGPATGVFRSSPGIPTVPSGTAIQNDGTLQAQSADTLTLDYVDPTDGSDTLIANAGTGAAPPRIIAVNPAIDAVVPVSMNQATVTFDSDMDASTMDALSIGIGTIVSVSGDNFDAPSLDTTLWTPQDAEGSVVQSFGVVNVQQSITDALTTVDSEFIVRGDFDLQIDLTSLVMPIPSTGANRAFLELESFLDPVTTYRLSRYADNAAQELVLLEGATGTASDFVSVLVPTLRLQRSGGTLRAFYDSGSGFVEVGTGFAIDSGDYGVRFGVETSAGSGDVLSADFDNFLITTGAGTLPGNVIPPVGLSYDAPSRTVTLDYSPPIGPGDYLLLADGESPTPIRGLDGQILDGEPLGPLPSGDGVPGGDFFYFFSVDATADLSVLKTGPPSAGAGGPITFTVVVTNGGAIPVTGASVTDVLTPDLVSPTWTCTPSPGSACATSGGGDIDEFVDLLPGGTATFTIDGQVNPGLTGSIINTADVVVPAGVIDPDPGNNSSSLSVPLGATADLSVTKDDGQGSSVAGDPVQYAIVVANAGPSVVTGALVSDSFPAILTGISWTCLASAGSACAASGSGDILDSVDLLVGGTATYTVDAVLDAAATGTLSNTGTVTPPAAVTDPDPGNNSATDTNTILTRPVADAGPNQRAVEGTTVTLDGSGSTDPDAAPLLYTWVQTTGPQVSLSGAGTAVATFTAPAATSPVALEFELTVDDGPLSDVDTAGVQVNPTEDWPQFRHDRQHSGAGTFPGTTTGSSLFSVVTGGDVRSSVVLSPDGTLYFGSDDGNVYAFDLSGNLLASFATGAPVRQTAALDAAGNVYIESMDGVLYSFTPRLASTRWATPAPDDGAFRFASPTLSVDGTTVYAGSEGGSMYAIDAGSGSVLWDFPTGSSVYSSAALDASGNLYFGSNNGNVYSLDSAGNERQGWPFVVGLPVQSAPAIGPNGTIFVGTDDSSLYALDPAGSQIWSFPTGGVITSSPAVSQGRVVFGSDDGSVYAVNAATGALDWSAATGSYVRSSATVSSDGIVYIGSCDGSLYAYNRVDGAPIFSFQLGGLIISSPTISSDGVVYAGSDDDRLYAVGTSLLPGGVPFAPVVDRVDPPRALQGESMSVRVEGRHFRAGMKLDLGPGVTVTAVTPLSGESLTAVVVVDPSAPVGTRGAVVSAGKAARGTRTEGFEVEFDCRRADLSGDGAVDGLDLALLAGSFGSAAEVGRAVDLDGDGRVDGLDLSLLARAFGRPAGLCR